MINVEINTKESQASFCLERWEKGGEKIGKCHK